MKKFPKAYSAIIFFTIFFHSGIEAIETTPEIRRIEKWGIFEITLRGPEAGNPFTEINLSAEFKNGDHIYTPEGFYDGKGMYKVRFMPVETGKWTYTTKSNSNQLNGHTGSFECIEASKDNHGPVKVKSTYYFAYSDGTPYFHIGTTCYAWIHQGQEIEEQTLNTLSESPFNKLRMCIFPKHYSYNKNEPVYYPFEGEPLKDWDFTRFNPEFWQHLEQRIMDLQDLGIEADIILFHTYDRWGFENMDAESDDRYIRYAVARLSAFRNVWWSLANEYDFMPAKDEDDWDRFFRIIQSTDPYQHLRSIHNGGRWYDHNKPWVTHASIQTSDMKSGVRFRKQIGKPVIYDECKYEGDVPQGWGQLRPQQMVKYFWMGTLSGCYVGHGETYKHPEDLLWWAKGGVLRGESPERIAFLKKFMSEAPEFEKLQPLGDENGNFILGIPGEYYLIYGQTVEETEVHLTGNIPYKIDVVDTWNMTIKPYGTAPPGNFSFISPEENMVYRFVPYKSDENRLPVAVASASTVKGNVPLTVNFSTPSELEQKWDFGDGSISQEANPSHTFKKTGNFMITLTLTDENGLSSKTGLRVSVYPATPPDLMKYSSWPGVTSGLLFSMKNKNDAYKVEIRNDATTTPEGGMILNRGAFIVRNGDQLLLDACKESNQLTVESIIKISNTDQRGPARIISYSKDSNLRNFTLGQEGENIVLRLRTPLAGRNGLNPQVTLCKIIPDEPMHIIVSYFPGSTSCFLNGKLVYQSNAVQGDFSNWEPSTLIFGDEVTGGDRNWSGKIEKIAIYNRYVGREEAKRKYNLLKSENSGL